MTTTTVDPATRGNGIEPAYTEDYFGSDREYLTGEPSTTFDDRMHRCYELTEIAGIFGDVPDGTLIVHGSWFGRYARRRIGHGWLVLPDGRVWEPIRHRLYDADAWYAYTAAIPERVYTPDEAAEQITENGHHGRWHVSEWP